MQVLVCIDDTDNLDSPGTGELADEVARTIRTRNWGETYFISRHQLFIHPDIPYTSHNSSMCFGADIDPDCLDELIAEAGSFLVEQSAEGSDPGLCVVNLTTLTEPGTLIFFGQEAKRTVLSKDAAYGLAKRLDIHLSEHGGTGQGVIGALAGAGLRLSGNDGRMRGRLKLPAGAQELSVKMLHAHRDIDVVQTPAGEVLPDGAIVRLGEKAKTVLLGGLSTLLVVADESTGAWRSCSNQELQRY